MEFIKPGTQFDFMGKRWYLIGLSAVLLVLSVIAFITPGPKLGTDFKGGTEVEVEMMKPVEAGAVRAAAEKAGFEAPDVVQIKDEGAQNRFMIRVQEVSALTEANKATIREKMCLLPEGQTPPEDTCPAAVRPTEVKFSPGGDKISSRYEVAPDLAKIRAQLTGVEGVEIRPGDNGVIVANERDHKVEIFLKSKGDQLMDGLRTNLGADVVPETALRVEWVGPKATTQLRDAAIKSVLIAIFFIMAYIAIRFDVRFAPGGIIALVHDVAIALGAMIVTQREITLSTVAAMLTIVGYSITDTVIVYDRIRENLAKHRDKSFSQIINMSISEMFGRTIISSGVTSLSMVMFLIWGTGAIKDFAFALLIGFIVGTYSSIYVAAPFTEWIDRRFFGAKAGERKKIKRTRQAKKADAVV
ncbi:MAG: protein translocase subunit SecF [Polyangiaceae bacterium]